MKIATIERPVDILLVEDNPGDARLAAEAVKESDLPNRLHWAADGAQATDFLTRGQAGDAPRPDLIILDLNLPGKDGRQVLAELKRDSAFKRIPVIVLSSSRAAEDRDRSYDLHANCYITKPRTWDEFAHIIRSIGDFWLTQVNLPDAAQHLPAGTPAPRAAAPRIPAPHRQDPAAPFES